MVNNESSKEKKPSNRIAKTWKWAVGILIFFLIVTAGASIFLNNYLKPILSDRIKETIKNSTDSLYSINFDDLSINLLTGNVGINHISFRPDTAIYQQLKISNTAPDNLFEIEVDNLFLQDVNPIGVYFKKQLNLQSIIIENPKISVYYENVKNKEPKKTDTRTAYQRLSKYLKRINIQDIVFSDAEFKYIDKSLTKPTTTRIKNLTIKIKDLLIDSTAHLDKSRFYYTKDVFVQLKNHKSVTKDKLYTIQFKDFTASSRDGYIKINDLELVPNYADLEYSRKFKFRKDRYSLKFKEIIFNKIDFMRLNTERRLIASALYVNNSNLSVFLNQELPRPDIDKATNFPQAALKRLPINTRIDTVNIKNANVFYTEYNPKSKKRGTVFFKNMDATIKNVTNDSLTLLKNNWANADVTALLMGEGRLNVKMNFNLTSKNDAFNFSGALGKMNTRILNQVLKPLALVEINSGTINTLAFDIKATNSGSTGTVKFYYQDLKVGILGKDDNSNKLKKKGLISILANVLVITNNNPTPGEPVRISNIKFERPKWGSFFNLIWKSIFNGVTETVGYGVKKQASLKEQDSKSKSAKQERIERREKRKEKREERRNRKSS